MLEGMVDRAAELSDDPLQQMLIIMRLMAERYVEIPGGYAGCILASATYQDRLFDAEVKAANRRAHLAWRDRFRGHFERIAAAYPPREPVNASEMADMINGVIEGGMILSGGTVSGAQALALGLVQWAVPADQFDEKAEAVVRQFAAIEPHAAQAAKAAINAAFDPTRNGYNVERDNVKTCLAHPRTRELVGGFLARSAK